MKAFKFWTNLSLYDEAKALNTAFILREEIIEIAHKRSIL